MSFSSNIPGLQNQLDVSIELPEDPKEMRDMLNDVYQGIASTVNLKEGALFVPIEKLTSGQYFISGNPQKNREVYRMVVDFGALPNTATKTVAHTIPGWNSSFRLVKAYGAGNDPIAFEGIPIPNDGIFLKNDATNVIVTTTANFSAFTESTIVLEFTKNL
jgi:hypothetical protein